MAGQGLTKEKTSLFAGSLGEVVKNSGVNSVMLLNGKSTYGHCKRKKELRRIGNALDMGVAV
jgi:hypothetical protein